MLYLSIVLLAQTVPVSPVSPTGQMSIWNQYGLPGLIIGALFGVIIFLFRQHSAERKEWREDMKELSKAQDETSKDITDKFVGLHRETLETISRKSV